MRPEPGILDLRWLLLGLGLAMSLHIAHFSMWVSASIAVLGIWRYLVAHYRWTMPRVLLLMPLTVFCAIGILITHHGLFGRDASVELLALMLMLKLMEAKTPRDFIILIFGGYFLTITTFLFSQSMIFGTAMLLPTFALTATLIGISYPNGNLRWYAQAKLAAILLAQATPIMLALFFLFPRVPGPLWGIPQDSYQAISGLSDSMEPGNISDLTLSGDIAFRVEFEGAPPPARNLYWRGPVLWHYDGRSWGMDDTNRPARSIESLSVSGPPTKYTITLEPNNRRSLLLLDMPTSLPPDSTISQDFQVLARHAVQSRIRYQASSHLDYTLAASINPHELEPALRIPAGGNPQTRALAQQWRDAGHSPEEIAQTALQMFHEQPFIYTLRPPRLGREPIDDFLFNTRRGFCEHYSSSFVYLMRAAGVPARVVTGYQGGELNPVGNYMIVRQSDAHAWAEIWIKGKGWLRIDPTAAVSPSRIESGIETAIPNANLLPLMARKQFPLLKKLYLNLDAVDNAWNHWILDYNQKRQLEILSRLAGSNLSWGDIAIAMIVTIALIGLLSSYFLLRETLPKEPLQRIYATFLRRLKRRGLTRHPHETATDFSKRAILLLPETANEIIQITGLYTRLRYSKHQNAAALDLLQELIRKLK